MYGLRLDLIRSEQLRGATEVDLLILFPIFDLRSLPPNVFHLAGLPKLGLVMRGDIERSTLFVKSR